LNAKDFLVTFFLKNLEKTKVKIESRIEEITKFSHVSDVYSEEYLINANHVPVVIKDIQLFLLNKGNEDFYYLFRRPSGMEHKFPLYEKSNFYKFFRYVYYSIEIMKTEDEIYKVDGIDLNTNVHRFFFMKNNKKCLGALVDHILFFKYDVFLSVISSIVEDDDYVEYYFNYVTNKKNFQATLDELLLHGDDDLHMKVLLNNTKTKSDIASYIFPGYIKTLYSERHQNNENVNNLSDAYKHFMDSDMYIGHNESLSTFSNNESTNDYLRFLKHHYKKIALAIGSSNRGAQR
jgi:hypothetical protein